MGFKPQDQSETGGVLGQPQVLLTTRLRDVMGREPTEEEVVAWVRMGLAQREALAATYRHHNDQKTNA